MGNVVLKSIYVGYTDASFSKKAAPPKEYGYLGPLIKAQARSRVYVAITATYAQHWQCIKASHLCNPSTDAPASDCLHRMASAAVVGLSHRQTCQDGRCHSRAAAATPRPSSRVMLSGGPRPAPRDLQVGDVLEIVFRNKLERPVNLVLAGGLIPDSPAHLATPVQPGHTVRVSVASLLADRWLD